jgi:hypothetical protein
MRLLLIVLALLPGLAFADDATAVGWAEDGWPPEAFRGCSLADDVLDWRDKSWIPPHEIAAAEAAQKPQPKGSPRWKTIQAELRAKAEKQSDKPLNVVQDGDAYVVNEGEVYARLRFPIKIINHTSRPVRAMTVEIIMLDAEDKQVGAASAIFFDVPAWTTVRKHIEMSLDEYPEATDHMVIQWQQNY